MNKILSFYIIGLLLFGAVILSGCDQKLLTTDITQPALVELSGNVMMFNSTAELDAFLKDVSTNQNFGVRGGGVMMDTMVKTATSGSAPTTIALESGASDYSQTNVQVAGVDEADFVKNDDKYIYLVQNSKLIIVDAYNRKEIVSETVLPKNNYASNMFLYDDRVVVLASAGEESFYFMKYDIMPQSSYEPITKILVFDVSNREVPKLLDEVKVSGDYFQSRMIDNILYTITTKHAGYPVRPPIIFAEKTINPNIYYFDNGEESYNYNTLLSFDVNKNKVIDSEVYMLGWSNTLMMSEDNIYIAYQKQDRWCRGWYCNNNLYDKERFTDVVVPLLEDGLRTDIRKILLTKNSDDEQWTLISERLNAFFNELRDDEYKQEQYNDMFNNIAAALEEYDTKKLLENSKTIIHKIGINKGVFAYEAKGVVDGRLLNQFSLDEYEGNLRLATTIDLWTNNGRKNYNNVYVLDKEMNVVGKIEKLAQNESIYSTRFIGDKLYMVTFRQIDPFFVIDLSNPKNPKVLGALKIPGYSSYLHPYNENFIIGVGKETGENEWGGVSTQDVKISLFDVSDFKNPKEVDKYEIGMQGTDSPILYEHKAFLLFNNYMIIPVSEITSRNTGRYGYDYKYWDGAYVFKVSESGFDLIGKIKHDSRSSTYYNWYDRASVTRSIIMDDELFTISNKFIKVNDLNDELRTLGSISLPTDDYPYYEKVGMMSEPAVMIN